MERKAVFPERIEVCQGHPEKAEIFWLEQMLIKAGYPYYFNFWEELKPTPFNHDGGDPETDIDWKQYNFLIEVGNPVAPGLAEISICFNQEGDKTLLELLDMRPAAGIENPSVANGELHRDITAEQAMEIIEKFFESLK